MCDCPKCGEPTSVKDSRPCRGQNGIRRRRMCDKCGYRFSTIETITGQNKKPPDTAKLRKFSRELRRLTYEIFEETTS